jgi:hypothetical protein
MFLTTAHEELISEVVPQVVEPSVVVSRLTGPGSSLLPKGCQSHGVRWTEVERTQSSFWSSEHRHGRWLLVEGIRVGRKYSFFGAGRGQQT